MWWMKNIINTLFAIMKMTNYLLQKFGVIRCTALEEGIYCEQRRVLQEIEPLLITFKISAFALINFNDFNKINKIKWHFKWDLMNTFTKAVIKLTWLCYNNYLIKLLKFMYGKCVAFQEQYNFNITWLMLVDQWWIYRGFQGLHVTPILASVLIKG